MVIKYQLDVDPPMTRLTEMYDLASDQIRYAIIKALRQSLEEIRSYIVRDAARPLGHKAKYGPSMVIAVPQVQIGGPYIMGKIGPSVPYGRFVEFSGDKSAKYKDILLWVKFKAGRGKIALTDTNTAAKAAYWITKSLNKKGSAPTNYLEQAVEGQLPLIAREFKKRIHRAAEDIVGDFTSPGGGS